MATARLHQLAEKAKWPMPVFVFQECGRPHFPSFKATVRLNSLSFSSPRDFAYKHWAKQAAAEVAFCTLTSSLADDPLVSAYLQGVEYRMLVNESMQRARLMPSYMVQRNGLSNQCKFRSCVRLGGLEFAGEEGISRAHADENAARVAWKALSARALAEGKVIHDILRESISRASRGAATTAALPCSDVLSVAGEENPEVGEQVQLQNLEQHQEQEEEPQQKQQELQDQKQEQQEQKQEQQDQKQEQLYHDKQVDILRQKLEELTEELRVELREELREELKQELMQGLRQEVRQVKGELVEELKVEMSTGKSKGSGWGMLWNNM